MLRVHGLLLASSLLTLSFGCHAAQAGASGSAIVPTPTPDPLVQAREAPPSDGMWAYTSPGELPQLVVLGPEGEVGELPLRHTDVDAHVLGHVAQVRVSQQFHNDREVPIEVTYTFPLPENAAVDSMRMVIGERVIEAEIQRRADARQTYEQARAEGYTSALLEQERPNIFTQSLANVAPGETIAVELTYVQTLSQDAGTYEFVFPMVVGPRFIPDDAVPDAARIMPPVAGEGVRTGHDVSLALDVAIGSSVARWDAPTHTVVGEPTSEGFEVRLADAETIPNRDFVIRWSEAGASPQARLLLGPKDAAGFGHFALVVQPPAADLDALVGRREMIFVVDRSGSMSGVPLALAKQTLREALKRLRPVDTFDVIGFESGTERLFGTPRAANADNLVLAERFIDGMIAGGGTMMDGAVEAALAPALTEGRDRYVFFLTDGFIGNEGEIFEGARGLIRQAERQGRRARVFGVGIGSSPNHHLIEGLSDAGDGVAVFVGNREHPQAAVERWYHYVDHPVLADLEVEWGGLGVEGRFPSELPDLFASHAQVVLGRYSGAVAGEVTLVGHYTDDSTRVELEVEVVAAELDDRILSTLWAREKIADMTAATWDGTLAADEAERMITEVGLDYRLVTNFTSFVAVDRSRVVGEGNPLHVDQVVEAPEDVDPIMAGGRVVGSRTSTGVQVQMEQAKRLPVGANTSRDFTAVVDLAPSGMRDAAGIALAGTSGAQSRYTIDGANVSDPAYGTVGSDWADDARLSLGRVRASEDVNVRLLRRTITRRSLKFEACYEQKGGERGKAKIELRLHFDAGGKLVKLEILAGTLGNADVNACVETVLRGLDWQGLPAQRRVVEIELGLRMR